MDKVENENEEEKKKLINLGRFVNFLKRFEENLSSYQSLSIASYLFDKKGGFSISGRSVGFSGDEIKDNYYVIGDMLVKLADYEIISCHESDKCISFDFCDDSDSNHTRYIYLTCFKKEIYK